MLNAAAALVVVGKVPDLPSGIVLAGQVIDDGQAAEVLQSLIRVSRRRPRPEERSGGGAPDSGG